MRLVFVTYSKISVTERWRRDFPGGPLVSNLPANAGDTGSITDLGTKTQHALRQGGQCTTSTEPVYSRACELQLLKPVYSRASAPQGKSPQREAHVLQLESSFHLLQLEKARVQQQRAPCSASNTQHSQK